MAVLRIVFLSACCVLLVRGLPLDDQFPPTFDAAGSSPDLAGIVSGIVESEVAPSDEKAPQAPAAPVLKEGHPEEPVPADAPKVEEKKAERPKRGGDDLPDAAAIEKLVSALRKWPTKKPATKPAPPAEAPAPAAKPADGVAAPPAAPPAEYKPSPSSAGGKDGPLNICTWNIFRFGPKKFDGTDNFAKLYGKTKLDMLVEQIKNADILALQEYFDPSLAVLNTLREALDAQTGSKWNYSISSRVGRVSKEQYVFLYRTEVASVSKEQVYPEPAGTDPYSREPFFTQFQVKKGKTLKNFVLGTIHTEPAKAVEEISSLVESIAWAEEYFSTKDVMVLGDYNADCQYVRKSAWDQVRLWVDKKFTWFVPHDVDTAAMGSECTFDRAVSKSDNFKAAFVPGSLKVLDFVAQYKIKVAEARRLSDHFPVCMQFD